jgi:hypothetical protein
VKSHTFKGRRYRINIEELPDGDCSQYKPEMELNIYADMSTRNGLITAIHEALHACFWKASEESVDQASRDIGRFLWGLGYRIEKQKSKKS